MSLWNQPSHARSKPRLPRQLQQQQQQHQQDCQVSLDWQSQAALLPSIQHCCKASSEHLVPTLWQLWQDDQACLVSQGCPVSQECQEWQVSQECQSSQVCQASLACLACLACQDFQDF